MKNPYFMAPSSAILIAILIFSLLSAILQIVGAVGPWQVSTFIGVKIEYGLLYAAIGNIKGSYKGIADYPFYALGVSSTALLSIAIVSSSVVLVFAGVMLQKALESARSPYAVYLIVPGVTARIGMWPSLPRALIGFAWTAMVFGAAGLGAGLGIFFLTFFITDTSGLTFPGRDCTIAAAASSLISAILASIAGDCCCCCCCSKRSGEASSMTSAPSDSAVDVRNPLPAPGKAAGKSEWIAETDGSQTWYLNKATGETSWTVPADGRLVQG
jgi:hypothetical protein